MNPIIWYKIPLPNGVYRLNLGFADCRATAATKKATISIEVEGENWRSFSPFDSVGAKVACFTGRDVIVNDGELDFRLTTAAGSTDTAFLNCFELYSLNPSGCVSLAEGSLDDKNNLTTNLQVAPNPFNPSTIVTYSLKNKTLANSVSLKVYSSTGECVRTLYSGLAKNGEQRVEWNAIDDGGKRVSSGLYIIRISTADEIKQIKVMLLK